MAAARISHTATLLRNGQVLVVDGYGTGGIQPIARAELYDPASGMLDGRRLVLSHGRVYHTATLLLNGKVLVSGGGSRLDGKLARAQLYKSAPEALDTQ